MIQLEDVPAPILEAVANQGGARLVLVLGSGCSIEHPTNLKSAADYARDAYGQLVDDNVLEAEDCEDPADLSKVADAVVAAGHDQTELVRRLPVALFQQAKPNPGYLRVAALLYEGVVDCTITLNYDLAILNALSEVEAGDAVHVVASADDFRTGLHSSVVFLHGHALSPRDEWIVRTEDLEMSWENGWQEVAAEIAAAAPVTVFVGLGSPAAVLVSSVDRLRQRVSTTDFFFVDPNPDESQFLEQIQIEGTRRLAAGWGELTALLSQRLMREYSRALCEAVGRIGEQDTPVDVEVESRRLCELISNFDIVDFGCLRASWLTDQSSFRPWRDTEPEWLAVAIVAIAILAKNEGAQVSLDPTGIVNLEFRAKTKLIGIVHGRSARSWVEARGIIEARWHYSGPKVRQRPECFVYEGLRGQNPDDVATPLSLTGNQDQDEDDLITGDQNYKLVAMSDILEG